MTLTADRLRDVLSYDPSTGVFVWLMNRGRAMAGQRAGYPAGDYWGLGVDGRLYQAHRVAWLYVTGEWPSQDIDHRDGDKLNNRFANLRDVPNAINHQNTRKARTHNRLGVLGVKKLPSGRYRSQLRTNGVDQHLGVFDTPEAAHGVYLEAKRRLHAGNTL